MVSVTMRPEWGLAVALLLPAMAGCIVLDRPLTAKPPGCWYFGAAVIPGMYEDVGEAGNRSGVESASRGAGPSLPLDGLNLTLPRDLISLHRVDRPVAFGDDDRRVLLGIEAAPAPGEAYVTALVWEDNSRQEVADLARPFLRNVTTASDDQVEAWAQRLAEERRETDRFPPVEGVAVDRPAGATSDGYRHNATIEPDLRLAELAEDLSAKGEKRGGQARPYSLGWRWSDDSSGWEFRFRVPTRVVATHVDVPVEDNEFILDVGVTNKTFAYAEKDLDLPHPRGDTIQQERALIETGFEGLGLPYREEIQAGGGRIC